MKYSGGTFTSSMEDAINYNSWIIDRFKKYLSGDILEIGIGHGGFYAFLKRYINSYTGMDINTLLIEAAKKNYPENNYLACDITSDHFLRITEGKKWDAILCVNVLEHISNEKAAVGNILAALKRGGYFLLFVPAFGALYCHIDRLAGHFRRYTRSDMEKLFQSYEIKIHANEFFNPIGGIGWWANRFIRYSSLESEGIRRQIGFFDKVVLPLSKAINPLTKRFFGQSLLCVVEVI